MQEDMDKFSVQRTQVTKCLEIHKLSLRLIWQSAVANAELDERREQRSNIERLSWASKRLNNA